MLGRVTGEASNLAFYAHDTKIVHHTLLSHLQRSLTQLTALEDIISLDKFITDVESAAQKSKLEARRRTMCALLEVTVTVMAWPMQPTLGIRQLP